MKTGFLRRYVCGSSGVFTDMKEAVLEGAAVWRNATVNAFRMGKSPPIPEWITIPNEDSASTESARNHFVEEERQLWFIPKYILEKEFWQDGSSTEDDNPYASNRFDDDDDDSYTASPRISWQQSSY